MDSVSQVHKHEYRVRDLPTRSVVLFASRAQIARDIRNVPLKPGVNEITIVGLTPTIDEQSIKVEGTGAAIITDITVESLPNRDIFEDIYPDSDDDKSSDSDSDFDSDNSLDAATLDDIPESGELKDLREKIRTLRDEKGRADDAIASSERRLVYLDKYYKTLTEAGGFGDKAVKEVNMADAMTTYDAERAKIHSAYVAGQITKRNVEKEIKGLVKEESKMNKDRLKQLRVKEREQRQIAKQKEKVEKIKAKEREKKQRIYREKLKEKARIRHEHEKFWPKSCFSVRIKLEAVNFTPMSSRRSSVGGVDLVKASPDKPSEAAIEEGESSIPASCDLLLSYVTAYAYWAPKYDLQLSTTNSTGVLCFDAELTNLTSETWTDCKVTLSTSQTTTTSLNDQIPTLVPWHVKLLGRNHALAQDQAGNTGDILDSREERNHKSSWQQRNNIVNVVQKPRAEMFGTVQKARLGGMPEDLFALQQQQQGMPQTMHAMQMMQMAAPPPPPMPKAGSMMKSMPVSNTAAPVVRSIGGEQNHDRFRREKQSSSLFASKKSKPRARAPAGEASFGGSNARRGFEDNNSSSSDEDDDVADREDYPEDDMTLNPTNPAELDFQESSFEETGLTTTYDLPGVKTMAPSSTASKQRVARISFASILFSHTVVAKYRPAAYLKAKMKNASKMTLLKGPTGLTLDGGFMGRTTLPRCSAGDSFTLPLGIDPAIRVAYPKPDVKRATTGFFGKEDSSVYTRAVTLANTKHSAGKPISVLVLDQVPVSEDEKLRVEVLGPRGMVVGGPGVSAGLAMKDGGEGKNWGTATATLKKGGQVDWDVSLNAGRAVKLVLEYSATLPVGERIVQC